MVNTTVIYDGKQIQLTLPDYPTLDLISKILKTNLPKTFDSRRHIVQLFDPTIGEYFDLNDNGLKSWLCLPMKEKSQMRLQIIRAEIDTDPIADVFQKIQNDIQRLFSAIETLQTTANGIRDDFQSALKKYQQEKNGSIRYPAEDIRFKGKAPTVPLVSDVYQDESEDDDQHSSTPISYPTIDIETPLFNVGEDFQALVSIAVNPSYFFLQNTFHTRDLEKLAQSMNDYYSTMDPPTSPFRPAEMSCCAARYSVDNRWYRARIKRYSSDSTVELVYVDYGNNEERPISELRPLDPAFTRLPTQAICAALELLPLNSDNQSSWTKKASYKFHEDTLSKPLDIRIIAQPTLQWPMYFVQMTIDKHTDVAETLISFRQARRANLFEIIRIIGPRLDLDDYAAYNLPKEIRQTTPLQVQSQPQPLIQSTNKSLSQRSSRTITLPALTVNLTEHIGSCTVTSIISPSHFFIQLTEKNQFEQLYNNVHETYLEGISSDRISRLKQLTTNHFGVARNPRDQRFYRVQIISHDFEQKTLLLLCFDIGEYINVADTSIYELLPEFQSYPAQALKCSLALIHSINDDWSRESIHLINRFVGGKGFKTFRFYSIEFSSTSIYLTDPPLPIILYDMNTSNHSINEQLIERKLAIPDSNYFESIRLANDAMNDLNGFKNQRIRQYIESQRTFTQQQQQQQQAPPTSIFVERYEPPTTTMPTSSLVEDDENLPYCPPVIDPELRHWYAVEVTHVKTPGEFFIRYPFGIDNSLGQGKDPAPYPEEIERNQMLNDLHREMNDVYSIEQRRGISTAIQYDRGQMVAVRYQSQWYRARVLEFKSATNFAWIQFVDSGETRELGTNTMRPLHPKFLALPLQAYLCRLDGFDSTYSWSIQDKDLFKKRIRDKILYAKKIREPNIVQLVDLVNGEILSFDSFWKTLHLPQTNKSVEPITHSSAPVRNLQPIISGLVGYASGSEYSQTSAMMPKSSLPMKKSSGAMIPPPPPTTTTTTTTPSRPTMQFISAGFKQPAEYAHLSPSEQLAQFQQQESHRIQPNPNYSINKHFR